jgi:hypothetical protein
MSFRTPILLVVFNRPLHTAKVLDQIAKVGPKYLYVVADGPRFTHPGDRAKIDEVRQIVFSKVNWDCELKTFFRTDNVGCGRGPSEGISWFFEQVDEGIILEDDCLPDLSFFSYCEKLLAHFRDDTRIMHISGSNFQDGKRRSEGSYYFSMFCHVWGWATWKRAWQKFSPRMDNIENMNLDFYHAPKRELKYWQLHFQDAVSRTDIWDYHWNFAVWKFKGASIIPNVNLVENIGFDATGTHTSNSHSYLIKNASALTEVHHPPYKEIDFDADRYTFNNCYSKPESVIDIFKNFVNKRVRRSLHALTTPSR